MNRTLRLLAIALALVLGAAACSGPTGLHWRRSTGTETRVFLVVPLTLPTDVRNAADRAARDWSEATGLHVYDINRCPVETYPGANCIEASSPADMGPGNGSSWSSASGHHLLAARIEVGSGGGAIPRPEVQNATCHEVGHGLGLAHGVGAGPCEGGHPTPWDLALIAQAYDHTDPTGPTGV